MGRTIFQKVLAVVVIVSAVIVAGLAVYFPLQQIEEQRQALLHKARSYGDVMSKQVVSAVAFSDRETAREVLSALVADADVIAQGLYSEQNGLLHSFGTVRKLPLAGQAQMTIDELDDRLSVRAPIVSPEGPRGTLVLEISTARFDRVRQRAMISGAVAGILALGFGCAAAWLLARSLSRRLGAVADAAARVADGDLDCATVDDQSRDEIGTLARAFEAMLVQLRSLVESNAELARKEQDRLETLVHDRTFELDQRNRAMSFVLDNVDQGIFTVTLGGRLSPEMSAAVVSLLGPVPAERTIGAYVNRFAHEQAPWFEVCWASLESGLVPPDIALGQLPRELVVKGKTLELSYKLIELRGHSRVMIVVSDVTARVQKEAAERDQREIGALVARLISDRYGLLEFWTDTRQQLQLISAASDPASIRIPVHTIKGSAGMFGIASIAKHCHAIEEAIALGDDVSAHVAALQQRFDHLDREIDALVDVRRQNIEVADADLEDLVTSLAGIPEAAEALRLVEAWKHEPIRHKLERLGEHTKQLAQRLAKDPIVVEIDSDRSRLPTQAAAKFWASLVHVVRNAVDHGIESPEERAAAGKPAATVSLRAKRGHDALLVEVEDRGRGIDWSALARKAGIAPEHATEDQLLDLLFRDGLSSRSTATETSGRGVGLAAVREACLEIGGSVTVRSQPGGGTTFGFVIPGLFAEQASALPVLWRKHA
jgi:two-component system, chemotaxis family, sensor kinase CheA